MARRSKNDRENKRRRKKMNEQSLTCSLLLFRSEVDSFVDRRNLPRDWKTSWWWWSVYIREEKKSAVVSSSSSSSSSFLLYIIFIQRKECFYTAHVFIYTLHTIYLFEHLTMTRNWVIEWQCNLNKTYWFRKEKMKHGLFIKIKMSQLSSVSIGSIC